MEIFDTKSDYNSDASETLTHDQRLNRVEIKLNEELKSVGVDGKGKTGRVSSDSEDFNKRGIELYKLAFDVAPGSAERQDIERLFDWIKPIKGEKAIDLAAGAGMFQYLWQNHRNSSLCRRPKRCPTK